MKIFLFRSITTAKWNAATNIRANITDWFGWLYIDQHTMKSVAEEEGWISEIVFEDDRNQYLAELYLNE